MGPRGGSVRVGGSGSQAMGCLLRKGVRGGTRVADPQAQVGGRLLPPAAGQGLTNHSIEMTEEQILITVRHCATCQDHKSITELLWTRARRVDEAEFGSIVFGGSPGGNSGLIDHHELIRGLLCRSRACGHLRLYRLCPRLQGIDPLSGRTLIGLCLLAVHSRSSGRLFQRLDAIL